jgi:hypothetical protein
MGRSIEQPAQGGLRFSKCDNITFHMEPHHHHHPGHVHPPATVAPSILRLSALQRLAAVAVLIAVLWGAVFWAMA